MSLYCNAEFISAFFHNKSLINVGVTDGFQLWYSRSSQCGQVNFI